MTSFRLDLPWPAPPLKDNGREHWAVKARKTRELRNLACLLARSQRLPRGLERVRVDLHWQPATVRRRDVWGAVPTLKPLVDGLVDYGLVADDDIEHVLLGCHVDQARRGHAACWLTITDLGPKETA